jgi:hypothetical protein
VIAFFVISNLFSFIFIFLLANAITVCYTYSINIATRSNTMSAINYTNATTFSQYNAIGPMALVFNGKGHARFANMYDNDTNTIFVKYQSARKQRGAFMRDQVSVIVRYDYGADLYDITIKHFDGLSMDSVTIFESQGHYGDQFGDIQDWINYSTKIKA